MFRVPGDRYRVVDGPMGSDLGIPAGAFRIESCEPGWNLTLICDDGRCPDAETGWEHVSVRAHRSPHRPDQSRVPTWREMCQVKALCWEPGDVVMQLHPAEADYVNRHPHVLHLWRPVDAPIPTPPAALV